MITIALRIKTDDPDVSRDLVKAWLEDHPVVISVPATGQQHEVDVTYVKERD